MIIKIKIFFHNRFMDYYRATKITYWRYILNAWPFQKVISHNKVVQCFYHQNKVKKLHGSLPVDILPIQSKGIQRIMLMKA